MQAAAAIFGKQNMSGMLAIINASEEDYNKLSDAIYGCEGSAKGMAETMQDNLAGQITILKSQLQELAISFGDILMPAIRAIVSKIQAFVDKLNAMDPAVKETIVKVALVAAALGPLLVMIGKTMIGVGKLMQLISNLPTIIAGAKSAFAAFSGVIGGISAPVVAVIAVIAALVAAFVHLWKTNEDFRNKITAIYDIISPLLEAFRYLFETIFQAIQLLIGRAMDWIHEKISAIWNAIVAFLTPILEDIRDFFQTIWDAICNTVSTVLETIHNVIMTVWNAISSFISDISSKEKHWASLEKDYAIREKLIVFLQTADKKMIRFVLPRYVKALALSITVHDTEHFTVHWFDGTDTEITL